MTEAKTDQSKASAIAALIGLIHPDARGILNALFIFFVFFALMFSLVNLPAYIKGIMSPPPTLSQCWELKEFAGKFIRFNKCTGDSLPFELSALDSTTKKR
jgi:hypothetical protein